jgi:hypothetical protein
VLTDRRAIQWRPAVISTFIVIAGLCQYGFIVVRTAQNARYLEARASNLRELFAVMRASRFSDQIFAFPVRQLIVASEMKRSVQLVSSSSRDSA